MDYFRLLPMEMKLDILTRLPVESVLDSMLVCTSWRSVVGHPSFSKMHSHHHLNHPAAESAGKLGFLVSTCTRRYGAGLYYIEYDDQSTIPIRRIARVNLKSPFKDFKFISSINGLICLMDYNRPPSVCIFNPITGEYLMLPEIKIYGDIDKHAYEDSTFGYVPATNEYKVVVTIYKRGETHFQVSIYTLGSGNGWRDLGKINCGSNFIHKIFFANGALYWRDNELKMIGSFDLAEEKFRQHLSPFPLPPYSHWICYKMGVLDGFLYFALKAEGDGFYDIWLLNNKNDDHDKLEGEEHQSLGWSKEFRIDDIKSVDLLVVTKSCRVLNIKDNCFINIYDTNTSTSKSLVKFKCRVYQVWPHKNTLVSLTELGEEDVKVVQSAEIENTKRRDQLQEDADPDYILL